MSDFATICHQCGRGTPDVRSSCAACGSEFIEHVAESAIPELRRSSRIANNNRRTSSTNNQSNSTRTNTSNNPVSGLESLFSTIRPLLRSTQQASQNSTSQPPGGPQVAGQAFSINSIPDGGRAVISELFRFLTSGLQAATGAGPAQSTNTTTNRRRTASEHPDEPRAWPNIPMNPLGFFLNGSADTPNAPRGAGGRGIEELMEGNPVRGVSLEIRFDGRSYSINGDNAASNFERVMQDLWNAVENPPNNGLSDQELRNIPIIKVNSSHVEKETQCSTCFDTFQLDESVAELNCHHIFHRQCVEPWLKQQRSCPICRQTVDASVWRNAAGPSAAPSGMVDIEELD